MIFAFHMCVEVGLVSKPFGTLDAVPLAKAWQIFCRLGLFVLFEMPRMLEIGVDLVDIARVSPGLLFGLCATDRGHGEAQRQGPGQR